MTPGVRAWHESRGHTIWTDAMVERLRAEYGKVPNRVLAETFGVDADAMRVKAYELGLSRHRRNRHVLCQECLQWYCYLRGPVCSRCAASQRERSRRQPRGGQCRIKLPDIEERIRRLSARARKRLPLFGDGE